MSTVRTITIKGREYVDIIPKDQPFDPETEELVYGDELRDGMVVIREAAARDNDNTSYPDTYNLQELNRWCRVTRLRVEQMPVPVDETVGKKSPYVLTGLEKYRNMPVRAEKPIAEKELSLELPLLKKNLHEFDRMEVIPNGPTITYLKTTVYFIAEYADGHKTIRVVAPTDGWIVKKRGQVPGFVVEEEPAESSKVETHPDGTKTVGGVFEV